LLRHSYKRDRISAISSLTLSPTYRHLGLYVRFHATNITGVEVVQFLRHLVRHVRGPVVLLWDGGTIHRRRIVHDFLRRRPRLHVYPFPAYAPELNPDEFVWTKAKRDLSNGAPQDIRDLAHRLRRSTRRLQRSQRLLWSCIFASDLPCP
jgi:putative transposase